MHLFLNLHYYYSASVLLPWSSSHNKKNTHKKNNRQPHRKNDSPKSNANKYNRIKHNNAIEKTKNRKQVR